MLSKDISLADEFEPVSYDAWRAAVEVDLKGVPFEKKLVTHTYEGFEIPPVYWRKDWDPTGDPSGMPGMPPFTRGASLLGNSRSGWDIRQEHAAPSPAAVNQAILTDLNRGVTSVLLRLDVAARNGMDVASEEAASRAGRDGVMLYDAAGFGQALKDVRLDIAGVALEAGAAFLPAAALLTATARAQGVAPETLHFAFNADPLAVLARDGSLPTSLETAYRDLADLAAWTSRNLPASTAVRVGTGPYHHAGANAAQDLGFSMATGLRYLRVLTEAGLSVEDAARQMVFSYSVGTNFFLAIAKLRAARKLWARVLEACGGDAAAAPLKMHVRPSKRVLTTRDPWVNMLRNTVCCFAGAVAGAEAITSEPFDKAIGLSNDFSRRIARNTQIILQEESHLSRVIDPAGGCWMVESQTDTLAELSWKVLQEVEAEGGMEQALLSGWVGRRIDSAFAPRAKNIAVRKDQITGVSEFPDIFEKPVLRDAPDYEALRRAAIEAAPKQAPAVKRGGVEALVEAAAGGATLAGMAAALWAGAAEAPSVAPVTPHPYAEPFEALRDESDRRLAATGRRPSVFLANMGPVAHHTARAAFAKNFFEAGGFEVIGAAGFARADEAAAAFRKSGARVAVICSSDKLYETVVAETAPALKAAGARAVVLAGFPGDKEAAYKEAGVDRFIYIKCNVLQTLRELLEEEEVIRNDS